MGWKDRAEPVEASWRDRAQAVNPKEGAGAVPLSVESPEGKRYIWPKYQAGPPMGAEDPFPTEFDYPTPKEASARVVSEATKLLGAGLPASKLGAFLGANALTRVGTGAGLGALSDVEHPLQGAATGAALATGGEGLLAAGRGIKAALAPFASKAQVASKTASLNDLLASRTVKVNPEPIRSVQGELPEAGQALDKAKMQMYGKVGDRPLLSPGEVPPTPEAPLAPPERSGAPRQATPEEHDYAKYVTAGNDPSMIDMNALDAMNARRAISSQMRNPKTSGTLEPQDYAPAQAELVRAVHSAGPDVSRDLTRNAAAAEAGKYWRGVGANTNLGPMTTVKRAAEVLATQGVRGALRSFKEPVDPLAMWLRGKGQSSGLNE